MATPAQATFNQSGLSGAFSKANANNQNYSVHQGDMEALRPRAQTTPNMTLQIQAATVQSFYRQVYYNSAQSTYAGGNTGSFTAPSTNPRIDLVYLNSAGSLVILQGTQAASPVPPTYPDLSQNYPICEVFCRVSMTSIVNFEDSGANPTKGYIYRDVRPFWATGGGVSAHSGLTGLTADDHTQYAKLTGRAGSQTIQGGTAASEVLNLESTSHGTKGTVVIKGGRAKFEDAGTDPSADGQFFRNAANIKFHDGTAVRTFVHSNTTAGGDLSGTYPNATVAKIQGNTVLAGTPSNLQVLQYITANTRWEAKTISTAAKCVLFGVMRFLSSSNHASYGGFPGRVDAEIGTDVGYLTIPFAGTLKNFYLRQDAIPDSVAGIATCFVHKNGSDTGIGFSDIWDSATSHSDTSNTATVAVGDTIAIRINQTGQPSPSASPVTLSYSLEFDPT